MKLNATCGTCQATFEWSGGIGFIGESLYRAWRQDHGCYLKPTMTPRHAVLYDDDGTASEDNPAPVVGYMEF